ELDDEVVPLAGPVTELQSRRPIVEGPILGHSQELMLRGAGISLGEESVNRELVIEDLPIRGVHAEECQSRNRKCETGSLLQGFSRDSFVYWSLCALHVALTHTQAR